MLLPTWPVLKAGEIVKELAKADFKPELYLKTDADKIDNEELKALLNNGILPKPDTATLLK